MAFDAATFMTNIRASMESRRQRRAAPRRPTLLSPQQPGLEEALERRRQAIRQDELPNSSNPPSP